MLIHIRYTLIHTNIVNYYYTTMKPNHRHSYINNLPPSSTPTTSTQHQKLNFSELDRINRIGSGFRGAMYKVLHRPTATHFALKEIYGDHDDDVLCQILGEINILHGVNNLNIVKCHNHMFDRGDQNIHVLVEYMDGGSLEGTHVSDESALANLTRQTLSGLHYLHNRNIEHRHIKPSSLFINSKKQVKIGLLGVSRILGQTTHPCNYSVSTIAYMSPERINTDLNKGKYEGCAGDIWSLGVCILELYMGVLPFDQVGREGDWGRLMSTICMSPPPKPPTTASPEFRDFVGCCLHKDPTKRWTAAQLLCHPFITGAALPS